jgi:hypothetical protein
VKRFGSGVHTTLAQWPRARARIPPAHDLTSRPLAVLLPQERSSIREVLACSVTFVPPLGRRVIKSVPNHYVEVPKASPSRHVKSLPQRVGVVLDRYVVRKPASEVLKVLTPTHAPLPVRTGGQRPTRPKRGSTTRPSRRVRTSLLTRLTSQDRSVSLVS